MYLSCTGYLTPVHVSSLKMTVFNDHSCNVCLLLSRITWKHTTKDANLSVEKLISDKYMTHCVSSLLHVPVKLLQIYVF